jgi:hypothetical protein
MGPWKEPANRQASYRVPLRKFLRLSARAPF